MEVAAAMEILRDHGGSDYRPDSHFLGNRICAHGANKLARNATQTTGSLVARLKPGRQTYFATGTAAPCTGIFKPIRFEGRVLPDLGQTPAGTHDPDTLWWRHEALHRAVLKDFQNRLAAYGEERDALEREWIAHALNAAAADDAFDLTHNAFEAAREKTAEWVERVRSLPLDQRPNALYRRYWNVQNKKAGIVL
jgi:dipeptidase